MNTFKGTHIQPLTETRSGQIAKIGEDMTMCDQISNGLQKRPIKDVNEKYLYPGYNVNDYQNPGEIT